MKLDQHVVMPFCVDGCPSCPTHQRLTPPGCMSHSDGTYHLSYRCDVCGEFWRQDWPEDLALAWATAYQRQTRGVLLDDVVAHFARYYRMVRDHGQGGAA